MDDIKPPKFPLTLRTTTKQGKRVVVRYRRIPTRDGFDIEAKIISPDWKDRPKTTAAMPRAKGRRRNENR